MQNHYEIVHLIVRNAPFSMGHIFQHPRTVKDEKNVEVITKSKYYEPYNKEHKPLKCDCHDHHKLKHMSLNRRSFAASRSIQLMPGCSKPMKRRLYDNPQESLLCYVAFVAFIAPLRWRSSSVYNLHRRVSIFICFISCQRFKRHF